jgi:putative metallohydrolase (TIGR04338 family)
VTTQTAVYAAEDLLRSILDRQPECPSFDFGGSILTLPVERKFADLPSMQSYVDKVLALGWVQGKYSAAQGRVTVRERRGNRMAAYRYNEIAIPPLKIGGQWAMRELVLLHEIAHHLAPRAGHDAPFQEAFLDLVGQIIGEEAALLLRVFIHENLRTGA